MTYMKPEVGVLGDAVHMIESTQSKSTPHSGDSSSMYVFNPAYDLDE